MAACGVGAPRLLRARALRRRPAMRCRDAAPRAEGKAGGGGGGGGSPGVELGPIGLTLGGGGSGGGGKGKGTDKGRAAAGGVELGPIGLTLGGADGANGQQAAPLSEEEAERMRIAGVTSDEWARTHVKEDGTVDLWLEDEFNAASRLPGASEYGTRENVAWKGEEAADSEAPVRTVTITDLDGVTHSVTAPEDRYILFEAEEQGFELPNACRMGCCTKCAVKIHSGAVHQPQALGVGARLKDEGYALLCVAFARGDIDCTLQDEDEVYMMQFGEAFEEQATDPRASSVLRDDFALELAEMDE